MVQKSGKGMPSGKRIRPHKAKSGVKTSETEFTIHKPKPRTGPPKLVITKKKT